MDKLKDTTVRVAAELAPRLVKLAQLHGLNQKELLAEMVGYFERTQADPRAGSGKAESLSDQLGKLDKRVDRVIGFIREQEKAILKPLRDEVRVLSHRVATRQDVMFIVAEGLKPEVLQPDFVAAYQAQQAADS
jgi:hypothetical protein